MPRIILNSSKDITEYISTIAWSGGRLDVARRLDLGMINSVLDKYTTDLYIKNGSSLKLIEQDKTLFDGIVFSNERHGSSGVVQVTAYDRLIYILKNKETYNFKNTTAHEVVKRICNQFQIPVGNLIQSNVKVSFIASEKTLYDIIMQAYTIVSKVTSKKYMLTMANNKLNVIEIGAYTSNVLLSDEANITDSGYTESIEKMVNRVKIYDDNQKYISTVENAEWIKLYGVLQDVYTKQKDRDAQAEAKAMLEGVSKDLDVEAIGNIECISGNAVKVKDSLTGITGLFYIDNDKHTWQNGQHIMRLKLNFEKIMDERE